MMYQRVFCDFPSIDRIEGSWSFTVFITACLTSIWMLYMTGHIYDVHVRSSTSDAAASYDTAYEDFDYEEFDREDSSYGNRVDDYYANALEQLYDHFGI